MTKEKSKKPILEKDHYTGAIIVNGTAAPISFSLYAGIDCRLVFEIDPIDGQTYLLTQKDSGLPGQNVQQFSLNGCSKDGKAVNTRSAYVSSSRHNNHGFLITVDTREATVICPLAEAIEKPLLRLWFRSFRSFRNSILETRFGTLAVHGDTEVDTIDDMSGYVALQASSSDPGTGWYKAVKGVAVKAVKGV